MILIYVTHPNPDHAKRVVEALLGKKLIACANILSSQSHYVWEEKKVSEHEKITLLKTTSHLWKQVKEEILAMHDYDIPCIIKFEVEANAEYESWVQKQVKN